MGFFDKLKRGLEKTRKSFTEKIGQVIMGYAKIDDDLLDDLEAIMISSDMGVKTTDTLMEEIRKGIKKKEINGPNDLRPFLQRKIAEMFADSKDESQLERPLHVIMVVGVNGVGKTTTIAKRARRSYLQRQTRSVRQRSISLRSGVRESVPMLSNTQRVPILRQSPLMRSRRRKQEKQMFLSLIQRADCIRNRT